MSCPRKRASRHAMDSRFRGNDKIKMHTLKNRTGVSLVELLVALLLSAVLALSVGVISKISVGTSAKYKSEMDIYADIAYGFKMMQKHIREMDLTTNPEPIDPNDPPIAPWVSQRLLINYESGNDGVFGLYPNAVTNSVDFVFVPNQIDETNREVLLSVPNPATVALNITRSGNAYTVRIQGTKNNIPFDMSTVILKRRG